ncbi:hypothetical protein VB774_01760 [Pseudanabaena galeata UHCC 0370]|uniref:Uncharacterized protein n=1 Tax=Pseudanabaena galeata UHCC 0370 TaxID=3110310 RepID=A0ABU5TDI4_9CYAN|nr:hypothetical protein [Pseudanabaena galeata]MEA5476334.1 hypothetical protein [Pseudanabaena galeata UHCC 0370]
MKQRLLAICITLIVLLGLFTGNSVQANPLSSHLTTLIAVADISESPAETEVSEPVAEVSEPVAEVKASEPVAVSAPKVVDESTNLLKQLETEILPQIESVLTPEQQEEFAAKIAAGTSFRKAFKAITLTPAQKTKLSTVFKAIPKKDIFATLTPAQKKQLFLKNKQLFIPSSAEIGAKITAGMQMAKDKSPLAPSAESIVEKVTAKMKAIEEKE